MSEPDKATVDRLLTSAVDLYNEIAKAHGRPLLTAEMLPKDLPEPEPVKEITPEAYWDNFVQQVEAYSQQAKDKMYFITLQVHENSKALIKSQRYRLYRPWLNMQDRPGCASLDLRTCAAPIKLSILLVDRVVYIGPQESTVVLKDIAGELPCP